MIPLSTRFKQALFDSLKSLYTILPMLFAVIGLIGLFQAMVTQPVQEIKDNKCRRLFNQIEGLDLLPGFLLRAHDLL